MIKSAINLLPDFKKQLELQQTTSIISATLGFDGTNLAFQNTANAATNMEAFLNDYILNLMSTLVVLPDNPEQGVLYLMTILINFVDIHYKWESLEIKYNLLTYGLVALSAFKQENYLYHIENGKSQCVSIFSIKKMICKISYITVESNDTLYGGDSRYITEIDKLINHAKDEALNLLEQFVSKSYPIQIFFYLIF